MRTKRRWPKGTYMKLIARERLKVLVGPEPGKKMSGRRLARYIDKHPSFIDHLLAGRSTSCKPQTAQRIAEALDIPLEFLFVPAIPSAEQVAAKQQERCAS